jgi:hypothetical protein
MSVFTILRHGPREKSWKLHPESVKPETAVSCCIVDHVRMLQIALVSTFREFSKYRNDCRPARSPTFREMGGLTPEL